MRYTEMGTELKKMRDPRYKVKSGKRGWQPADPKVTREKKQRRRKTAKRSRLRNRK